MLTCFDYWQNVFANSSTTFNNKINIICSKYFLLITQCNIARKESHGKPNNNICKPVAPFIDMD